MDLLQLQNMLPGYEILDPLEGCEPNPIVRSDGLARVVLVVRTLAQMQPQESAAPNGVQTRVLPPRSSKPKDRR